MYRVIAYQGNGEAGDVNKDLRLLWGDLRNFIQYRHIRHIYCFQSVRKGEKSAELLLVIQYDGNTGQFTGRPRRLSNEVDYWFYRREARGKKGNKR